MTTEPTNPSAENADNPVADFSNCHIGIIKNFEQLRNLAIIEIQDPVQTEVKQTADKLYKFFREVVLTHHEEEEQELFTVVRDCARPGEELNTAEAMVKRLTNEHRSLEKQWKKIEADIKKLSKGKKVDLNKAATIKMAEDYLAHADYEEREFLPLSAEILKDTGLSSLGLSVHMRHTKVSIPGYI
ncbi:MAG: hemerythrin domain-containing protein [Amphritea sp.]